MQSERERHKKIISPIDQAESVATRRLAARTERPDRARSATELAVPVINRRVPRAARRADSGLTRPRAGAC